MQWRSWVTHRVSLRVSAAKIVSRLRNASLASALDSWRSSVQSALRMRHVATKIVCRLKHGLLSSVLDVWMCWVDDQSRLRHVLVRMSVASLARAFGTWADAVRESQMSALRESSHEALQSANAAMEQLRTEMAAMAQEHA